jgi:hypothetical protein
MVLLSTFMQILLSVSIISHTKMSCFNPCYQLDCTGPVSAGIKWLQREGFGHSIDGKYPKGTLPLEDLRISYDQKINYSTLEFKVSKELGERLNVPGGWEGCGPIYNCFTDGLVESRSIYSQRIEGDIGVCRINDHSDECSCTYSPGMLRCVGNR